MSIKATKKIGFWSALAILIGSVVGIGIFFKNSSVSKIVESNGVGWLLAWILGAIIALFTAIAYSELGSAIPGKRSAGLSYWSEKFGGKKLGYFTRFNYSFFYIPILIVVLGFFASEFLFKFFENVNVIGPVSVWVHVIFGTFLSFGYIILNKISIRAASFLQNILTILKFAPILISIIVGLSFARIHTQNGVNGFTNDNFDFANVIRALPAVLFAFDAFLIVGTLTNKVKGGAKTISKVVVIGMLFTSAVYLLITLASILHGSGSIGGVILDSLPASVGAAMTAFVNLFIFISAVGVINGFTAAYINESENATFNQTWFGAKKLSANYGSKSAANFYLTFTYLFWWFVVAIPALVTNSDAFIDGISNFPTLFFFFIYALIILIYAFKRKAIKETKKVNSILFYFAASISVVGIFIAVVAQFVVGILVAVTDALGNIGWGLFAANNQINNLNGIVIYFVFLIIFFALPTINYFLIKIFEKRDPLVIATNEFSVIIVEEEMKKQVQNI